MLGGDGEHAVFRRAVTSQAGSEVELEQHPTGRASHPRDVRSVLRNATRKNLAKTPAIRLPEQHGCE